MGLHNNPQFFDTFSALKYFAAFYETLQVSLQLGRCLNYFASFYETFKVSMKLFRALKYFAAVLFVLFFKPGLEPASSCDAVP
jgi:hypothetical protein